MKEHIFLLGSCWHSELPGGPASALSEGFEMNFSSLSTSQGGCSTPRKGFTAPKSINFRRNFRMLQNLRDHHAFYPHFHA